MTRKNSSHLKRHRNQELSKLIDFPNQETKDRLQHLAYKAGKNLKNYIEGLLTALSKQ